MRRGTEGAQHQRGAEPRGGGAGGGEQEGRRHLVEAETDAVQRDGRQRHDHPAQVRRARAHHEEDQQHARKRAGERGGDGAAPGAVAPGERRAAGERDAEHQRVADVDDPDDQPFVRELAEQPDQHRERAPAEDHERRR